MRILFVWMLVVLHATAIAAWIAAHDVRVVIRARPWWRWRPTRPAEPPPRDDETPGAFGRGEARLARDLERWRRAHGAGAGKGASA